MPAPYGVPARRPDADGTGQASFFLYLSCAKVGWGAEGTHSPPKIPSLGGKKPGAPKNAQGAGDVLLPTHIYFLLTKST